MNTEPKQRGRDWACLRTFVLYHAILAYLFTGNVWWTLFATLLAELLHSLFFYHVYVDYIQKLHAEKSEVGRLDVAKLVREGLHRSTAFWVDFVVSVVMVFVATFAFVLVEYVFNAVVMIGELRRGIFLLFFFLLVVIRTILLFFARRLLGVVIVVALFISLISIAVGVGNQAFYVDPHTLSIAIIYSSSALVLATLFALRLGYYSYITYGVPVIVILAIFWDNRSPRPFAYYLERK